MSSPRRLMGSLPPRRGQRGIVIFVALIVMVALSLAGVALVRAVDTTTAVVGNLAFRQAAMLPANLAVEQASAALFSDVATDGVVKIVNKEADLVAQNYFASLQPGEDPTMGIPAKLKTEAEAKNLLRPPLHPDPPANDYAVRYVIERVCRAPGPASADNCDMMAPKQALGTTAMELDKVSLPRIPFYRLTIRVDGPRNTVSFLQAMLR